MMRRNVIISMPVFLVVASLVTACSGVDDCKTCSKVSYQDNKEIGRTPGVLYCGDELAEKENAPPVTVLDVTTVWECE